MILGASGTLSRQRVDYLFISTHGSDLHRECEVKLAQFGYRIPVSLLPEQSYSFDGLLVAHRPGIVADNLPVPAPKPAAALSRNLE